MTTNPFTEEVNSLLIEQKNANTELFRQQEELHWFRAFDFEQANTDLRNAERAEAEAQAGLPARLQREVQLRELVLELDQKASLGIDPRYWFSSERAIAKRELAQAKGKLAELGAAIEKLRDEFAASTERRLKALRNIEKARRFEPLNAEAAVVALQAALDGIEPRLENLRRRRDELDAVIREPLADLLRLEGERAALQGTIVKAERFDAALSRASSPQERGRIHGEAERAIGDGKPRNVLREKRARLSKVDDDIRKLRSRIDGYIRFATQDIRRIVIDGNNMCYSGSEFLGFQVLEAVVPMISKKYELTLIFDASIRRRMAMQTQDIKARFPSAKLVHVVANKRKADETILAVAEEDEHTFVVSNDRFADFPEKMAVKERRMLRHEIVGQVAYIHDLHIIAKFGT